MITNPYSSLLTAYPHLCHELETIPANEIAYASPQSWICQETPLPQASYNLQIIAVWNAAARSTLINTILHGCKIFCHSAKSLAHGVSSELNWGAQRLSSSV